MSTIAIKVNASNFTFQKTIDYIRMYYGKNPTNPYIVEILASEHTQTYVHT